MNPNESAKQKLERYQRTQELTNHIRFNQESKPFSKTAEGSVPETTPHTTTSSSLIQARSAIDRNDMDFIRSYIQTLSELDPANPYYTNLLKRDSIPWDEFQEIVHNFSTNHSYLVRMQDEINNLSLAAANEGDPEEAPAQKGYQIVPEETQEQPPQEQDVANEQQTHSQEQSSTQQIQHRKPTPKEINRPLTNRERFGTKEAYAEFKEKNREERSKEAKERWDQRRAGRQQEQVQSRGVVPRGRSGIAPKIGTPGRLAGAILKPGAASGSGLFSALNNYLNTRAIVQGAQWLANKLGLDGLGRLLGKFFSPEKFLGNALKSLGQGALQGISSLGRLGLNGLSSWLSGARTALGIGRGALTIAQGASAVAATAGIILTSVAFWWVAALVGLFAFTWWFDQQTGNSECDKPDGEMRVVKSTTLGDLGQDAGLAPSEVTAKSGDKLGYVLTVNYNLACRSRVLEKVTVTDALPAGIEYSIGSSKSGFSYLSGTGVDGVYDESTRTLTWVFDNFPAGNPVKIYYDVTVTEDNFWAVNQATVSYTISGLPGGKILSSQSISLEQDIVLAAQSQNIPTALLKAIIKTEAPKFFDYSEEEFKKFSQPGWWEGLEANASTIAQNHPDIVRGYAYNTCAYRNDCAQGADVRGVTQFELATWNGIASNLKFSDNHTPDRRNAYDALFGSALLNRRNAESYVGSSDITWTEDVVKAVARMYCGGGAAGKNPERSRVSACGWDGKTGYDDFVWRDYKILTGAQ